MMKSAGVTLTLLAGLGGVVHAQTRSNPCAPGSFNPATCQAAVQARGYCDNGAWVRQKFQTYPYYYDLYRTYVGAGGAVDAPLPSACRRGGFGFFGVAAQRRHAGS